MPRAQTSDIDSGVIKDGAVFQELVRDRASATFGDAPPAGARAYYRLEVRGETLEAPAAYLSLYDGLIAMTNPIYVGYD